MICGRCARRRGRGRGCGSCRPEVFGILTRLRKMAVAGEEAGKSVVGYE